MNGRALGGLIWRNWTPVHDSSNGTSVNVPLFVTRTPLQPPNQPWYAFCQAFMWRQPPPIGSKRSPYSLAVQPWVGSSRKAADGPHASDEECCMPKLCPGSCTRTTQLVEALYQVLRCGRSGVPTDARPLQLHELFLLP